MGKQRGLPAEVEVWGRSAPRRSMVRQDCGGKTAVSIKADGLKRLISAANWVNWKGGYRLGPATVLPRTAAAPPAGF